VRLGKSEMQKLLYIWTGEFGWEIAICLSVMNIAQHDYDTTIMSYQSAAGMYKDMNLKFVPHHLSARLCGLKGEMKANIMAGLEIDKSDFDIVHIGCNVGGSKFKIGRQPKIIREDINPPKKKQVLVHARQISVVDKFAKAKYKRDWQHEVDPCIQHIIDMGYEVGFIGLPDQAICLPDMGHDWRSTDLESTITRIKESAFVFGPASGPSVLSVFCGVPVFTWGCRDERLFHQKPSKWNPFQTPHYHPWSNSTDPDAISRYKAGKVTPEEINAGVDWMLENADL